MISDVLKQNTHLLPIRLAQMLGCPFEGNIDSRALYSRNSILMYYPSAQTEGLWRLRSDGSMYSWTFSKNQCVLSSPWEDSYSTAQVALPFLIQYFKDNQF